MLRFESRCSWAVLNFIAIVVALVVLQPASAGETALDRYVAKPDPTYEWKVIRTIPGNPLTQYVVDLKSQTWRTTKDVDRPVWQHWLYVVKPANPIPGTAFLHISNGVNGTPAASASQVAIQLAEKSNSVVAELMMVPNQPLVLHQDGVPRSEDDFIAYTWDQFIKTGDETWPARLPMVKSAVRAMDCVQELMASDQGGNIAIEKFVVSGGSKRGWTTWCTAAVDDRVTAIIPLVIDVLNVPACSQHQVAAYGFYAQAIRAYVQHDMVTRRENPRTKLLYEIEDPYSYRERLTLPKYVVNAAGDQFFAPDSSQFYYDDLPGEKYLRYVPNTDHSLKDSDARECIIAFYETVLDGTPRPKYSWTFEDDGSIRVTTKDKPTEVALWQATNPKARDFRETKIGRAYRSQRLNDEGGGTFVGKIDPPAEGWTAFFVELTFDVGQSYPLKVSTAVRVLPDTLPFADLDPTKAKLEPKPAE